MKKQEPKNKTLINLIYLVLFLFILSWIGFWGNNSFYNKWRLSQKTRQREEEVRSIAAQNDTLRQENHRLQTDPEEQKLYRRAEHGIYEEGEKAYIFKPAQEENETR